MTNETDEGIIQLVLAASLFTGIGLAWLAGAFAFDTLGEHYAIGVAFTTFAPATIAVALLLDTALHLYRRFSR